MKAENIMGYKPRGKSIFGLVNSRENGLDVLVKVPPPSSIEVRNPKTIAQRNHIDGVHGGKAPTETLTFEKDTLVVFEVKSTLTGRETPAFGKTQENGGEEDVERILELIRKGKGGWSEAARMKKDPEGWEAKYDAVSDAFKKGRINYIHA